MGVRYLPVPRTCDERRHDSAMLPGMVAFLGMFLDVTPGLLDHEVPIQPTLRSSRAFGACTVAMASVILCIELLVRIDRRFLPPPCSRRRFGVRTVFVAITRASDIPNPYGAFSTDRRYAPLPYADASQRPIAGVPFEAFAILALLSLAVLLQPATNSGRSSWPRRRGFGCTG